MTGGVCRISLQSALLKFAMGEGGGSQKKAPGGTGGRRREKAMERTNMARG